MDLDSTVITGLATAAAAAFGWLVRGRNKQLDVATTWQLQMIDRVASLEADLKAERRRTDGLERQNDTLGEERAKWRSEAQQLKWQYEVMGDSLKTAERNLAASRERIAVLESEARSRQEDTQRLHEQLTLARMQSSSLATEQRNLRSEIAGGFQSLRPPGMATIPVPAPVIVEGDPTAKED